MDFKEFILYCLRVVRYFCEDWLKASLRLSGIVAMITLSIGAIAIFVCGIYTIIAGAIIKGILSILGGIILGGLVINIYEWDV